MRIGIIGQGNVGSALGSGWTATGHEIRFASRSGDLSAEDVASWAEIIVLAIPYGALDDVIAAIRPATGKIVIDCTNPIARTEHGLGLAVGHTSSGAEKVQIKLPEARVVKTLNQVGAEIMASAKSFDRPPVQLMAGNDEDAKLAVGTLLSDLGFDVLDTGDLTKARLLEPFALVWINQAMMRGKGRNWAFVALDGAQSNQS